MKANPPPSVGTPSAAVFAISVGALVPIQSRITGELGSRAGDGYYAAMVSFGIGLALLTTAVITASGRAALSQVARACTTGAVPRWYFFGGLLGAFLVLAQGLTVATLGVAVFTVALVAGQATSSAWIDRRGLGSMPGRALSPARIAGSVLTLVSVFIAVSGDLAASSSLLWLGMPLLAGFGSGIQQAVNSQVGDATGSVLGATWTNFLVGFTSLLIAFAVHGALVRFPASVPSVISAPWLYSAGLIGCLFIASGVALVRRTGVLLFSLASVSGQLLGSLILDLVVPPPGQVLRWTSVAGTALALVAVVISTRPSRPHP